MRRMFTAVMLCGSLAGKSDADPAPADPIRAAVEHAVARVRPSLVRIHVVEPRYWGGREIKNEAYGSGTIITPEGHVITNHHVAGHALRIMCTLPDNEEIPAILVGTDALSDIAIIKLQPATPRVFPTVPFGDSDQLAQGQTILAMGSPMALAQSVTLGIVSNTRLTLPPTLDRDGSLTLDGEDVGSIVRWIGHDAAIYGGNSGGPLVNIAGEMVGVNELDLGLSAAIPANLARESASELIASGRVRRSWLGIDIQPALKHAAGVPGVLVGGVLDGSPAAAAGLKPGDVIVRLDGRDISARFREELPLFNRQVAAIPVGRRIDVVVTRDGKPRTLPVTTAEREPRLPDPVEFKTWGLTARNLSGMMARELKLPTREGALVTSLRPGGPAGDAKPALEPGDVIVEFAGAPVGSVESLAAATAKRLAGATAPVASVVRFLRRTEQLLTVVKVGIRDLPDPGLEVKKAWLPAAVQVITRDLATQLGDRNLAGVRVTRLYPGGARNGGGLKVGDLIVGLEGQPIPATQPGDEEVFTAMVRALPVGSRPALSCRRDGKPVTVNPELIRMPQLEREMPRYRDDEFEFTARDVSFFDRVNEDWPETQTGAIVTEVKEGGWSSVSGLSSGDLILAVGGTPIPDTAALETALHAMVKSRPPSVVLQIRRGIHQQYLELEPAWSAAKPEAAR